VVLSDSVEELPVVELAVELNLTIGHVIAVAARGQCGISRVGNVVLMTPCHPVRKYNHSPTRPSLEDINDSHNIEALMDKMTPCMKKQGSLHIKTHGKRPDTRLLGGPLQRPPHL
jgi:hypothetical protein